MATRSTRLLHTDDWNQVCFPVSTVPLTEVATDYEVRATDRQQLIVGEPEEGQRVIYAVQSNSYSIIPNTLIRAAVTSVLGQDCELDARISPIGEFTLNIILPASHITVGTQRDTLQKNLIINNSYNGKNPFTIQGSQVAKTSQKVREHRMKVSYYRQVCTNGLMGWSDDFMTMDDYLAWLLSGQPQKYQGALKVKTTVDEGYQVETSDVRDLLNRRFTHKGLDVEWFQAHLERLITEFVQAETGLTHQVYERLATKPVTSGQAQELLVEAKLPKMLARQALERMKHEERQLQTGGNLWLLYNAVNHTLFNAQTSLSIQDRYEQDERTFHGLATITLQ